jgi:NADPH:quinone reductase-like Zn-dependent oxidoreductase
LLKRTKVLMTDQMTRWELSEFGASKLALRTVDRPQPRPGEILVRVEAVALNYRDAEIIDHGMGLALAFPFTPTSDMAGEVVAVGHGVTRFMAGDQVISVCIAGWIDGAPLSWTDAPTQGGPINGMLSEYVATPADWCVKQPRTLTPEQASTLPTAGLTAWMALFENGALRPDQTVVVQGTGGVSTFAIQFAAAAGARVIVTSSSEEKIAWAKAIGAHEGINRRASPDWHQDVLRLTGGRGADHILEMAGGENLGRSLQAIVQGGKIWMIGLLGSDTISARILPLLGSRASIVAISVGHRRGLEDLVRMVDRQNIQPVIARTYLFQDVREAFTYLRGGTFGKVVVRVAGG